MWSLRLRNSSRYFSKNSLVTVSILNEDSISIRVGTLSSVSKFANWFCAVWLLSSFPTRKILNAIYLTSLGELHSSLLQGSSPLSVRFEIPSPFPGYQGKQTADMMRHATRERSLEPELHHLKLLSACHSLGNTDYAEHTLLERSFLHQ